MRRILLITLTLVLSITTSMAGKKAQVKAADQDTSSWRYEVSQINIAKQGCLLLEVWSYSKTPSIAAAQACKNAIHAVIYKGVPAGGSNTTNHKPLVNTLDVAPDKAAFLSEFFQTGGAYMSYVALTSNGVAGKTSVLKVSKKEYKVGVTVEVNEHQLRSALESKGIIRGLSSGF
ncbi:MAG: hypothetical protein R3Y68_07785 [Rikenellaceae bacterium]